MNAKQRRTRDRILESPTRSDVRWDDVRSLFKALGADEIEGSGPRVRFTLNGRVLSLHRPHPKPELKKYAVEDVRDFLIANQIEPEEK
jgi:hypothetical protein